MNKATVFALVFVLCVVIAFNHVVLAPMGYNILDLIP